MTQPPLCHVVDPLRRFDPSLTESDLNNDTYIGNEDREQVRAHIDEASKMFESATGRAVRKKRVGSDDPKTWEYHDARRPNSFPLRVNLEHDDIVPVDPEIDTVEVRTGRNDWDDITQDEGDEWNLRYDSGEMNIYRLLLRRISFHERRSERFLRINYRYGALGGSTGRGGQTTLGSSVTTNDTQLDVTDASRLPGSGILYIDDPDGTNDEYARITDIDYGNDTVTVSRGVQATDAGDHDLGDVVHYAPESIRSAVAAKAAVRLQVHDDFIDQLRGSDGSISPSAKVEQWNAEWESTLHSNSGVARM